MANMNMNDMKKLAGGAAAMLAQQAVKLKNQSVVLAKKASDKAAVAGKLAVINANIGLEKQKLNEKAKVLGLKYAELFGTEPAEALREETAEMLAISAKIAELQAQAEEVKKVSEVKAEEAPAEEVIIIEEAPVEDAPVEEVPVEEVHIEEAPVEEAPVQGIPEEEE